MMVGVLGINHKCADLGLREKLAKACQNSLDEKLIFNEFSYIILSTCNRTEIYFSSLDLSQTHSILLNILRFDIEDEFEHKLYSYFHFDCFTHLVKVTSGLDSAILAETEIQGQVKNAYETAQETLRLSKVLHFMFQKSLKIAKSVRNMFKIGRGVPKLEEAVSNKVLDTRSGCFNKDILFIGASDINKKLVEYFNNKNIGNITLCNRSESIECNKNVTVLPWEERHLWPTYSTVIVATKSYEYLLKVDDYIRDENKILLIDLSVPRNIDPALGFKEGVNLYNIDQLNAWIIENQNAKILDIQNAIYFIEQSVRRQITQFILKEKQKQ